jgi:hypothetical protein
VLRGGEQNKYQNRKEEKGKMKILFIGEWEPKNVKMMITRLKEWYQELKKNPEKYGKILRLQDGTLCNFTMAGKFKGFMLLEVDERQLGNAVSFWQTQHGKYEESLTKLKCIPIVQGSED